jgi:hypothetical protein
MGYPPLNGATKSFDKGMAAKPMTSLNEGNASYPSEARAL